MRSMCSGAPTPGMVDRARMPGGLPAQGELVVPPQCLEQVVAGRKLGAGDAGLAGMMGSARARRPLPGPRRLGAEGALRSSATCLRGQGDVLRIAALVTPESGLRGHAAPPGR
jgi:hypothetical protein